MCRNSEYCSIFTTVLFFFKIIYFYYVFLWKCKTTQRRTIIFFRCTKPITIRIYYGHMINNVSTVLLMKFFCSAFLHKHKACIYYIKKVIYFIEIVYTNTEVESYIGSIGFISLQIKQKLIHTLMIYTFLPNFKNSKQI